MTSSRVSTLATTSVSPAGPVTISQTASGTSSSGNYTASFANAPVAGDALFAGLDLSLYENANRTTSIAGWAVVDPIHGTSDTNDLITATTQTHIAAAGESKTEAIAYSGGNYASGVLYDFTGADPAGPLGADTWGHGGGSNGTVTCPAAVAPRAGSIVVCEVYVDGGTSNPGVIQAPTPAAGWTFDRAAGGQYAESFGFHLAAATTTANQSIPAASFTLISTKESYWCDWVAETIVIQPPAPAVTVAAATPVPGGAETIAIAQQAAGNNGGGAGYSMAFPAAPAAGDMLFGGLSVSFSGASRTTSLTGWTVLDPLNGSNDRNGNIAASSYTHVAAIGGSNVENVAETGGNWASGVIYDLQNVNTTSPIEADVWASGNAASATCPAVTPAQAGSFVVCEVYLDAGTASSSVKQSPTPGTGWTFDRASGAQYEEVFGFHTVAPTAGATIPAMSVALTSGNYNWVAETVVFAPAIAVASPTPQPWPSAAFETPTQSDALAASVGVNLHLGESGSLYASNFSQVLSLLQGVGIRHIRDAMHPGQSSLCTQMQQVGALGIALDQMGTIGQTESQIASWMSCVGSPIASIEGANEYDESGDPNWASVDDAFQHVLYSAVKSANANVAVIGPSVTSQTAFAALGDLSGSENDGNLHAYFAGYNPGTAGWGGQSSFGTYGSLAWNLAIAKEASLSKPIVITETGYGDTGTTNGVPAATKGRYTLRTILETWKAGIPRTYLYELADEGTAPFNTYGIVDSSGNPKPVYTALKLFLGALSDQGSAFTPTPLGYAVGAPSSVQHVLLQRRNGTYELVIWNEAQEWNPSTNAPITTTAQPVTLTFEHAPSAQSATVYQGGGTTSPGALTVSGTTTTLTVDGDVTIVDITP